MSDFDGPGDEEFDELAEAAFLSWDAGFEDLFSEARNAPEGEREYWRRALTDDPLGPQMSLEEFEVFWKHFREGTNAT